MKVENLQFLIPFQELSKKHTEYLLRFASLLGKSIFKSVKLLHPSGGIPFSYQAEKIMPAFVLSTPIESLFLAQKANYLHAFSLRFTNVLGIIVSSSPEISSLKSLKGKRVYIPQHGEWVFNDPVLEFCYKSCDVYGLEERNPFFLGHGVKPIHDVQDGYLDAAITTTFELYRLSSDNNSDLNILGLFPIFPEMSIMIHEDLAESIPKVTRVVESWKKTEPEFHRDQEFLLSPVNSDYYALLNEAIELLDYSPQMYIENKVSVLQAKQFRDSSYEEIKRLKEKVREMTAFNDKLLKAYSEIKASKESLSLKLEKQNQNYILFKKEGEIIGVSRGFLEFFGYTRMQILKMSLYDIIEGSQKPQFEKLLNNVEIGLIKSFESALRDSRGKYIDVKMSCTVLELQDSKIILANISE